MAYRLIRRLVWSAGVPLAVAGCASTPGEPAPDATGSRWYTPAARPASADSPLTLAAAVGPPSPDGRPLRPAYAQLETLPIDLPTVLRLVDANSPTVGVARARVAEAQARVARAEVQWLPTLSVGAAYNRFDGQTQNQAGNVFGVSRANLFYGGGPGLTLDVAEALYGPLVARRVRSAAQFRRRRSPSPPNRRRPSRTSTWCNCTPSWRSTPTPSRGPKRCSRRPRARRRRSSIGAPAM